MKDTRFYSSQTVLKKTFKLKVKYKETSFTEFILENKNNFEHATVLWWTKTINIWKIIVLCGNIPLSILCENSMYKSDVVSRKC